MIARHLGGIRSRLDRDTLVWAVAPAAAAAAVVALFAVPNYVRALRMQDEAQRLEAVSSENISQRNNLLSLERQVTALRERARRCRHLAEGTERERLLPSITRPTDGTVVREQSIRTGALATVEGVAFGGPVRRREVTVDMSATFESAFGVLEAAEGIDQIVTPRVIEFTATSTPIEQALEGRAVVRAVLVFDEWFEAERAPDAPGGAR